MAAVGPSGPAAAEANSGAWLAALEAGLGLQGGQGPRLGLGQGADGLPDGPPAALPRVCAPGLGRGLFGGWAEEAGADGGGWGTAGDTPCSSPVNSIAVDNSRHGSFRRACPRQYPAQCFVTRLPPSFSVAAHWASTSSAHPPSAAGPTARLAPLLPLTTPGGERVTHMAHALARSTQKEQQQQEDGVAAGSSSVVQDGTAGGGTIGGTFADLWMAPELAALADAGGGEGADGEGDREGEEGRGRKGRRGVLERLQGAAAAAEGAGGGGGSGADGDLEGVLAAADTAAGRDQVRGRVAAGNNGCHSTHITARPSFCVLGLVIAQHLVHVPDRYGCFESALLLHDASQPCDDMGPHPTLASASLPLLPPAPRPPPPSPPPSACPAPPPTTPTPRATPSPTWRSSSTR